MKTFSPTISSIPDPTMKRGVMVMLFSVVAFSVNTLLLRYLSGSERGVSPEVPLLFRAGVGMVIVLVFFRGRRPTRIGPVFRERLLILRGLTGLLGTAAYYWTVPTLGAGTATLICNTYVIFASIIAVMALGEHLTVTRFLWLAASFIGIVFLVGPSADARFSFGIDEGIALVGAILAASSVVLVRKLVAEHSIGTIYLSQCVWIFLPVVVMAGPQLLDLSTEDLILLVIGGTAAGFGQLAMNEGYRCLSVSTGASIQMLWPVLTMTGGWLIFDEWLSRLQLVGAILILVGTWRVTVSKR